MLLEYSFSIVPWSCNQKQPNNFFQATQHRMAEACVILANSLGAVVRVGNWTYPSKMQCFTSQQHHWQTGTLVDNILRQGDPVSCHYF